MPTPKMKAARQIRLTDVPEDIMKLIVDKQVEMMKKTQGRYGREAALYKLLREAYGNR